MSPRSLEEPPKADVIGVPACLPGSSPAGPAAMPSDAGLTVSQESVRAASRSRVLANVYRLRILGIVDIVSYHADEEGHRHLIGGLGLPVVLLLAVAFSVRGDRPRPFRDMLLDRWHRLMIPWFFWSAVYGLLRIGAAIVESRPILGRFEPNMLLYGTWIHLWYLPFVFFLTLAAQPFHRIARTLRVSTMAVALSASVGALFVCDRVLQPEGPPWVQWTFGAPALAIGFLFGRLLGPSESRRVTLAAAGVVVLVLAGTWALLDFAETPRRYLMAATAISLVLARPGRLEPVTRSLADTFYGVYLIHPAVLRFMEPVSDDLGWVGSTLVATVVSMLATLGIRSTRLKRFV